MSIRDQIAQAEAAAANLKGTQASVGTGNDVALAPAGGAVAPVDMSYGAVQTSGGLQPDSWLNVDATGMRFNKADAKTFFDELVGEIDFSNVKTFVGLRTKQPGNSFNYIKSYDGKTESRSGKPWPVAMQEALSTAVEPAEQYRGADILITSTEEVTQGKDTKPAGTNFGHTTPVTGFGAFQTFLNDVVASGEVEVVANPVDPQGPPTFRGLLAVKATHIGKSNANYSWGIMGFERV